MSVTDEKLKKKKKRLYYTKYYRGNSKKLNYFPDVDDIIKTKNEKAKKCLRCSKNRKIINKSCLKCVRVLKKKG